MKKLFLTIFSVLLLVSCGTDGPEDVAKNFVNYAYEGKIDKLITCVEVSEKDKDLAKGKLSMISSEFTNNINRKGGLKSIETIKKEINENTAYITLKLHFKNGGSNNENFRLYKKENRWYIKL